MARSVPSSFQERDCEACGYFVEDDGHAHCPHCGQRYPLRRHFAYRKLHLGKLPKIGAIAGAWVGAGVGAAAVLLHVLKFDLFGLPFPILAGALGGALTGFAFTRKSRKTWPTAFGAALGIGATLFAGANWWLAVLLGALAGAVAGFSWFWLDVVRDHPPVDSNHQSRSALLQKRLRDIIVKRSHFDRLERKISGKHAASEVTGKKTIAEAVRALDRAQGSTEDALTVTELEMARNALLRLSELALDLTPAHHQDFEIALADASQGFRELRFRLEKRRAIPAERLEVLQRLIARDETSIQELQAYAIRREIARETKGVSALTSDVQVDDSGSLAPVSVDDEAVLLPAPPVDLFSDELENELARLRAEHRVEGWEDEADLWEEPFE